MKTRIVSAAVLLPLLLVVLIALPKLITALLFGVLGALGVYELLYSTGYVRHPRLVLYSMVSAFVISLWSFIGAPHGWGVIWCLVFVSVLFAEMMASHVKLSFDKAAVCMAAGLLIPFLFNSFVRIHILPSGRHLVLIPFLITMMSDSGAYFAGKFLGRKKLAPVISPNKTVEGVVGGVVSAVLGMLIYGLVLKLFFHFQVNFILAILYALVGSGLSVFGDLCFSVIKRQTGIKDYGNLIPGHGGILDRFDSAIFVGPMVEALILMIPVAVV